MIWAITLCCDGWAQIDNSPGSASVMTVRPGNSAVTVLAMASKRLRWAGVTG